MGQLHNCKYPQHLEMPTIIVENLASGYHRSGRCLLKYSALLFWFSRDSLFYEVQDFSSARLKIGS